MLRHITIFALLAADIFAACSPAQSPVRAAPGPDCRQQDRAAALVKAGDQAIGNDLTKAISDYQEALKLDPANHGTLWKLALAYESKADWPSTAKTLKQATSIAPDFANYWLGLGYAQLMQAKVNDDSAYQEAKAPLGQCIAKDPKYSECYFYLGEALAHSGAFADALGKYSQSINLDPSHARYYAPLARLYLTLKLESEAKQVIVEGIRAIPAVPGNHRALGELNQLMASIAKRQGDTKGAEAALSAARKYSESAQGPDHFTIAGVYAPMPPPAAGSSNQAASSSCASSMPRYAQRASG